MVTMYCFTRLRALIAAGLNNSEIARELKIHRSTVSKYRASNTEPGYKKRLKSTRQNPLTAFEKTIKDWIATKKDLSATSIFLFIKQQGYTGSLRTVERRVETLKAELPKERFFEQTYTPGEQSQFDFKESISIPFASGPLTCHLFIATLPFSGRFFAKAFPNKTYEAFADGMHSFFEAIGGMSKAIRFDNLSPVVKKVLKGSERLYTQAFERAIKYYGFDLLPCAPAKGNEKGDCERDIRTFARRIDETIFLAGKVFRDFDDFNTWLCDFSIHQLTEKQRSAFLKEIESLKPLPLRDESVLCHVITMPVSKHGTVRLNNSSYSVPDTFIQRRVKVVISAYHVKIYQISPVSKLIATHPRVTRYTNSILLQHTISSLVRKPQAMVRWAHRSILFPQPIFEKYYKYLQKTMLHGAEAEFLKSLNLIHHTSLAEIAVGLEIVLANKSSTPFSDLKSIVTTPGHRPPMCSGEQALCQPPIHTELSHYDRLIPA